MRRIKQIFLFGDKERKLKTEQMVLCVILCQGHVCNETEFYFSFLYFTSIIGFQPKCSQYLS